MLRELTVEETLMHSAQMRLPRKYSRNAIKDKVDDVLAFLGLSAVRNSLIGDEVIRGISGGQRRRVNIGMELVAEPIIMFLDEPTCKFFL
jgi:ABC-type multidrug transport system ATPase subunit